MCLICGVSVNPALSNLHRQAANLSHYMKRDKEFEKECANPFLAPHRLGRRVGSHLDFIGVERVKNLKIFFPAGADFGGDDGGIQDPFPCV
jgi:hypothetical protein